MAAATEKLTLAEFDQKYRVLDQAYEFWHGQAIPKATPDWIHGFLQYLISRLLADEGYIPGSEIELRIIPEAHPIPDVIATWIPPETPYPTSAVDVVVEILSSNDSMSYMLEKCRSYKAWGFQHIYVVDPDTRLVFRWTGRALEVCSALTTVPVDKIWQQLDQVLAKG